MTRYPCLNQMQPIFASDFGNLGAFIAAAWGLGFAMVCCLAGLLCRESLMQVLGAIACIAAGAYLIYSIRFARNGDEGATVFAGVFVILIGIGLLMITRYRRRK